MDDLVAWLRQQLDEDEAWARAALEGRTREPCWKCDHPAHGNDMCGRQFSVGPAEQDVCACEGRWPGSTP